MNETIFGDEARKKLKEGIDVVYNSVAPTLGAKGRNAAFFKFGRPKITNDGVTIARGIDLKDPFQRIGAELIKEAAEKTNRTGGDGTTTATVLAHAIISRGLEEIAGGANPMVLWREIENASKLVIEELKKKSIPVKTDQELLNIATVSVQSPEIGRIVMEAVRKGGKYGKVIVEESEKSTIEKEEVEGMLIESGFVSPYMVTDPERMEVRLASVPILITDKSFHRAEDLIPIIEKIHRQGGKHMLIVAEDITGPALQLVTINRLKNIFHAVVIKKPYHKESLEDLAILTGGTAITSEKGIVEIKETHLGSAQSIVVDEERTIIAGGGGHESNINARVEHLKKQIEDAENEYDREKLEERLAKLSGGVVIIRVGASTETEMKYLRDKIDDAVNATKAAVEEGILPGGGKALFDIAPLVRGHSSIVADACEAPLRQILANSGVDIEDITSLIQATGEYAGYDALRNQVVPNLVESGIVDPTKVTRSAVENAASLGAIFLTIESVRAEVEDDKMKM